MADEHVLGGTNVKIYYDKSTNGEILYCIGALVFTIISFGIENWINILLTTGWIFVLLISISLYSRRKYYIKREEDNIIFVIAFYTETLFSVKTPDAWFERPVFFSQAVNSASLAF